MKNLILALLSENSQVSMMRLLCLVCIFTASSIAIVCLFTSKPLADVAILVSSFLVPAFGGKVGQKYFEKAP